MPSSRGRVRQIETEQRDCADEDAGNREGSGGSIGGCVVSGHLDQ